MNKLNCWEFKKCGREINGKYVEDLGVCPAASLEIADGYLGGINGGRACFYILGTTCNGCIQSSLKEKREKCLECGFYKMLKEENGTKMLLHTFHTYLNFYSKI